MIERLPPELLSNIFFEIQRAPTAWTIEAQRLPPCSAVSQVCRQWRSTALGTSRLWNRIPVDSPQWAKACISRSRLSCLEVTASILIAGEEQHAQRQSLLLVYPELPRISVLEFETQTNHPDRHELLTEVFDGLSARPALMLRKLSFSFMDGIDMLPVLLPETLFASQRLISLESANFYFCRLSLLWSRTLIPPALRELTLTESCAWRNVDEMIEFFQLVPNLQSLHLDIDMTDDPHFDTSPSSRYPPQAVSLAKLETFHVSARYLEEVALIVSLSIPPTASLEMRFSGLDWDLMDMDQEQLAAALARGTQAYRDHFASAVAAGHGYTHVKLNARGIEAPCTGPCELHRKHGCRDSRTLTPTELAPITFPFGSPIRVPHLFHQAHAMLLEQPVIATTTAVCIHGPLQQSVWSCFERWTAVETLELAKFGDYSALSVFVSLMCGQGPRLFPALRELLVVDSRVIEPKGKTTAPRSGLAQSDGLRGTNAHEFVVAMRMLSCYEHFERLTFIRCVVSAQALRDVKDIFGAHRVEGDVVSPEGVEIIMNAMCGSLRGSLR
ncbi:hypothetical protein PENSPDRAFT_758375 [Peniophora sp. CONT]|nr:hypothetical protein PENSPDRAFT_758375 [Peniophora sp. CONT]